MAIPSESPIVLLPVICQCGCCQLMTPEVNFTNKGKVAGITYFCDTSKYALTYSFQYMTNQPAKYKEPKDRKSIAQHAQEAKERAAQPKPEPIKVPPPTVAQVPVIAQAEEPAGV